MSRIKMHYIAEWAEFAGMRQADIVERMDANKSSMSKWFAGALPSEKNLLKIADILGVDVLSLFHHPADDKIIRMIANKPAAQKEKLVSIIETAVSL